MKEEKLSSWQLVVLSGGEILCGRLVHTKGPSKGERGRNPRRISRAPVGTEPRARSWQKRDGVKGKRIIGPVLIYHKLKGKK